MGKSNGFDVWWMLTIWMCLGFRLGVIGAEIDARIDIVAILSEDEHFEIEAQRKLSEYFEIGETKAQMAVISEYDTAKSKMGVLLNFTANRTVYLETLKNWNQREPAVNTDRVEAFTLIRRILFVNRGQRAKAVIMMITQCSPTSATGAAISGMELNNNTDVWLYVMAKNHPNPCAVTEAEQYTPDKERLFVVNRTGKFTRTVEDVKRAILDDLCKQWEQGCVHIDESHTQCRLDNWLKHMNNISQCSTQEPTGTSVTCASAADCDKECDKRWPLERIPDCDEACEANRITIVPPINMEYCAFTVRHRMDHHQFGRVGRPHAHRHHHRCGDHEKTRCGR